MTAGNTAASVRFQDVVKAFGDVVAVRDISFTIEPGSLVTLLGPSGCGKTTTLRLIAGLEMSTSGKILIGEKEVTKLPASERDVCMVFQSYALFPHMTVLENVAYGLSVSGMPKAEAHAKAEQQLALVGLKGFGARLPSELSGGQQQRVAVARALILEPQVLLFDEPLSNLDAKLRRHVRQEICDLQRSLGLTTVYVTHDQEEALAVSDRIIVMRNAEIAQTGTPHELYEEPADLFVADFIGDANVVTGEIKALDGALAVVDIGGVERRLPHRGLPPGEVDVAIRPEAIHLSRERVDDSFSGTVSKATYLGSHLEYSVETPLGELFVIDHRVDGFAPPGTTVSVVMADRGVTLVGSG
ncbi:MAG: ABC transporter ATP-binding protein [Rhodospirillales bacterium]|nr:ABC transporter ATP-binding protein [Rhodospirillales bacterium]